MKPLLSLSRAIDDLNRAFGWIADALVLLACFISAGNAVSRYLFSASSNAWLEIQWYMFSGIFLLGAAYTLKKNEHVRVDIIYSAVGPRTRLYIDIFGIVLFLMPAMLFMAYSSWFFFYDSFLYDETSQNAGGIVRWPVKILMPIGFLSVALQGISELIKRVAALQGLIDLEVDYERPVQ